MDDDPCDHPDERQGKPYQPRPRRLKARARAAICRRCSHTDCRRRRTRHVRAAAPEICRTRRRAAPAAERCGRTRRTPARAWKRSSSPTGAIRRSRCRAPSPIQHRQSKRQPCWSRPRPRRRGSCRTTRTGGSGGRWESGTPCPGTEAVRDVPVLYRAPDVQEEPHDKHHGQEGRHDLRGPLDDPGVTPYGNALVGKKSRHLRHTAGPSPKVSCAR